MNVDLRQNRLSAVGIVLGIAGLASFFLAFAAVALAVVARRLGERIWWWAMVAGIFGIFAATPLKAAVRSLVG